jgi:hypothetical protein
VEFHLASLLLAGSIAIASLIFRVLRRFTFESFRSMQAAHRHLCPGASRDYYKTARASEGWSTETSIAFFTPQTSQLANLICFWS